MPIDIEVIKPKSSNIAFCYSTKDRVDLTKQTIDPVIFELPDGFDLYWIDGSESESGKKFPQSYVGTNKLCEIHRNVGGGADVAILYNLSMLLEKGYDYIGLIENDVLLEAGWFKELMALFEKGKADGLKVGSVSARTYNCRVQVPRDGYALMRNVGAGMVLFTAEAVRHVLDNFHAGTFGEVGFLFENYTGLSSITPWQAPSVDPAKQTNKWSTCADWLFEASMLPYGMATLGLTPSMAKNIDDAPQDDTLDKVAEADKNFDWLALRSRYQKNEVDDCGTDLVKSLLNHYDPMFKEWRAFPHQLIKAIYNPFKGSWGIKWTQFEGPFSFITKEDNCTLELPFHGAGLQIVYDNGGKDAKFLLEGTCGTGEILAKEESGKQCINIQAPFSGPHTVKITFDKPGVIVSYFHFEGPQSWFKSKYALRYKDFEDYMKD